MPATHRCDVVFHLAAAVGVRLASLALGLVNEVVPHDGLLDAATFGAVGLSSSASFAIPGHRT